MGTCSPNGWFPCDANQGRYSRGLYYMEPDDGRRAHVFPGEQLEIDMRLRVPQRSRPAPSQPHGRFRVRVCWRPDLW